MTKADGSKNETVCGKMSGLDAAQRVLAQANGKALSATEICERAQKAGYWSPEGKTPAATLYSAILMEVRKRGANARFKRGEERGSWALTGKDKPARSNATKPKAPKAKKEKKAKAPAKPKTEPKAEPPAAPAEPPTPSAAFTT